METVVAITIEEGPFKNGILLSSALKTKAKVKIRQNLINPSKGDRFSFIPTVSKNFRVIRLVAISLKVAAKAVVDNRVTKAAIIIE